jgi:hypothetical protein
LLIKWVERLETRPEPKEDQIHTDEAKEAKSLKAEINSLKFERDTLFKDYNSRVQTDEFKQDKLITKLKRSLKMFLDSQISVLPLIDESDSDSRKYNLFQHLFSMQKEKE